MATEIESLQISINAKAQSANRSIDALVGRLDILSKSLGKINGGSTNITGLANGVDRLGRAMQTMNTVKSADFTRLANNLAKLGNINVSALNSTASSLSHLTRAFNNVGSVSQNAVQVSELAKNLGKLGNKSVTSAIANIPQLATAMNNLMTTLSKAPKVSQNVIQMTNALANLSTQGSKVGSASSSIERGLNRASKSAIKANFSFKSLASVFGSFYANAFLFIRGIKGLWKSINMTADYVEAFNYYTVSFGKVASKWDADWENYADDNARNYANKFVTTLNKTFSKLSGVSYDPQTGLLSETGLTNLGLNLQEVTQYAAQLGSMLDAVGQNGEVTLATTNAFVKLAGDISSLYNIDYQEAADKIRSVLQGQSRAGYGFGWDTTMAALQATADKLDLSKPVSEMTQWEKQQLRILTILEQSRVAYGDQSNTINTLANQIRLFKNNIAEAGTLLGQLFVPLLTKLMPIINGITIAIKRLLSNIAGLLGIEIKDVGQGFSDMQDDIGGIEDSFDNATASAKKFKTYTLGIDELNIQPEQTGSSGSGGGAVGGGIDLTDEILQATSEYERVWQEAFDKMENRALEFANKLEEFFRPITDPLKRFFNEIKLGGWTQAGMYAGDVVVGIFDTMSTALEEVDWDEIGNNIGLFLKGIEWTKIFKTVGNFIETLVNSAVDLWKGAFSADPIATTIVTALGLAKFTGLGKVLSGKIVSAMPQVLTVAVTAVVSFEIGKEIGKKLFPEDAQWYDNFTWLGEGGFFDSIANAGWANSLIAMNEMAMDLYSTLAELNNLGFLSPLFQMLEDNFASIVRATEEGGALAGVKEYFNQFVKNIETFGQSILDAGASIETWFTEDVQPWFTEEKWSELWENIKTSFSEKWQEITEWWSESGIGKWFSEDVKPFFSKKTWDELLKNVSDAFKNGFKTGVNNAISALNVLIAGIETTVNNGINALKEFANNQNLLASALGISVVAVNVNPIKLNRIPAYKMGGFPEDGLFYANHNELVGKFSNGKTAVANNEQIVSGIEGGVERAVERVLAPYLADIAQNTRETADKDYSVNIGDREIARANNRGQRSLGYALIT